MTNSKLLRVFAFGAMASAALAAGGCLDDGVGEIGIDEDGGGVGATVTETKAGAQVDVELEDENGRTYKAALADTGQEITVGSADPLRTKSNCWYIKAYQNPGQHAVHLQCLRKDRSVQQTITVLNSGDPDGAGRYHAHLRVKGLRVGVGAKGTRGSKVVAISDFLSGAESKDPSWVMAQRMKNTLLSVPEVKNQLKRQKAGCAFQVMATFAVAIGGAAACAAAVAAEVPTAGLDTAVTVATCGTWVVGTVAEIGQSVLTCK